MKKGNSFFTRLLICILGACIIPSIVTITVYYRNISGETLDRIGRSNIVSLEQISSYMDDLVYTLTTMPKTHKSFADASLICETHFGDCIINVYRMFRGLSEMPEKIDIAFLYSFKLNYAVGIFTKKSSPMLQYFPQTSAGNLQFIEGIYPWSTLIKAKSDDNYECLLMATPVRSANYSVTGTIFTGVYIQTIKNYIASYMQEYTGNVAAFGRDGGILFSVDESDSGFIQEISGLAGSRTGNMVANTSHGKYLITSKTSAGSGIKIISYIPETSILSYFNPLNYYSLYVIMMFAVLALIAGIFALRVVYKPLRSLADYAKNLDNDNGSKNEILIIKNALDSLNSSKQSLSAIIRDNRYIIKYRTFCEFIYGQPQTNYPGFNFNGKTNLVIAMTCISISANDDDGDYYKTLRALHIAEFINQKLAGLSFGADILQTYKNEIIIILMNTAVIPDAAIKVREILASLNNNIRLNFTDVLALNTGVGIAADKPSMISESYFLARRAMEYAKINGEFNIIFQEDYIVQENSTDLVTWENRLLKLLADRKTEPIKILVDEITEEAASTPARFTYDRLYDFYVRIIFESILSFSQINPKIAQTLSQKPYISDFSRTGNLAEKGRWLKSFYSEIISITLDPENNPGLLKNKIRGACEYIRENYTRLITLDDIAQKVNLNPSYFSTVFKAQTGLTFTDYINKMRIDEAKSLLKTGESISGISAAIGYVSVNQLNRFFKKYEKITPAQYRENLNFTGQS